MRRINIITTIFIITSFNLGCKKLIQVDAPVTSTNSGNVYTSDATAAAVLTGIYAQISNSDFDLRVAGNLTSISLYASLSADELVLYNLTDQKLLPYYRNDLTGLTSSGGSSGDFWGEAYPLIFIANSAIEGLNGATSLTPGVKQHLLGEAKFLRAFFYFYLTNLYGDVPLVISSNYKNNDLLPRTPASQVYQQIVADLMDAEGLLSSGYLQSDANTVYPVGSEQRVRPTKWAASALLARVYLYTGEYAKAEAAATAVLNNSSLYNLAALNSTFLANSTEAIWQLQPVRTGTQSNTGAGALFILPSTGPSAAYPVYLDGSLVNSFEPGDLRKTDWTQSVTVGTTTYYYPFKYKIGKVNVATQENIMILRLAEQYLIRAEARAQQGNLDGARADLNSIRARASLSPTAAADKPSLLNAIFQERKVELFTEWGDRWFDLKRTGNIDAVMTTAAIKKGGVWSPYKAIFPVPAAQIILNNNLVQNTGY